MTEIRKKDFTDFSHIHIKTGTYLEQQYSKNQVCCVTPSENIHKKLSRLYYLPCSQYFRVIFNSKQITACQKLPWGRIHRKGQELMSSLSCSTTKTKPIDAKVVIADVRPLEATLRIKGSDEAHLVILIKDWKTRRDKITFSRQQILWNIVEDHVVAQSDLEIHHQVIIYYIKGILTTIDQKVTLVHSPCFSGIL